MFRENTEPQKSFPSAAIYISASNFQTTIFFIPPNQADDHNLNYVTLKTITSLQGLFFWWVLQT